MDVTDIAPLSSRFGFRIRGVTRRNQLAPNTSQIIAIDQELLTAVRLIKCGFGQLQQMDGANDFYHLPLLALSSGFERYLKVILCFRHLERTGEFPDSDGLPRGSKGHDLELLLERVRKE